MTQTTGAALLFIHALAVTQFAAAQTSPDPESAFGPTVERALQAYDAERWDDARLLFEQAHALEPTARTLRAIGMVAFNQADHVSALLSLEASLVDTRKPLSPEQRAHAEQLIGTAEQRIGLFRLRLAPANAVLSVDGKPPRRRLDGRLVLAPGHHQLTANAAGHRMLTRGFEVTPGDRAAIELELEPDPVVMASPTDIPAKPPPHHPAPLAPAVSASGGKSSRSTWAIIVLSTSAAALVTAGVTGALAFDAKAGLSDACSEYRCPRSQQDEIERYDTLRTVTTVTLASALAFGAIGTFLLLGSADAEHAPGVQAVISGQGIGIQGRL
jgi:hypothetical protein